MSFIRRVVFGLLVCSRLRGVAASANCPLIGIEFPRPRNVVTHPIMQEVIANLTALFNYIDTNETTGSSNYSYSVQIFSANPGPKILFEAFHTATNLAAINSTGVKTVDENSIYRLGSLSKVFTVLAFLVQDGDAHWNDPVVKYVPELAEMSAKTKGESLDPVTDVDWEDVTLGALASQMSGIARDYGVLGEILNDFNQSAAEKIGFPPLPDSEVPTCGAWPLCNRTQFFEGVAKTPPSFSPWTTPAYSNIAYQILGYALENIAGKDFVSILNDNVLYPLNLTSTYYYYANESLGILPGNVNDTFWNVYLGDASPTGNMYSSAKDLTTLGLSILKSTLIRPALTRRWLKPTAFTSDPVAAVGAPWGIRRIRLGPETSRYRSITAFNKAGRFRWYTSLLVLLPDFDIGFTILGAGNYTAGLGFDFADIIGASIVPAYDAAARDEAGRVYSGTYSSMSDLNSTLTITTDPSKPGLGIGPWISNGTDMVDYGLRLQAGSDTAGNHSEVRLFYTGREVAKKDGSKRQAFKAVFEDTGYPGKDGRMFSTDCASWLSVTGVSYGAKALDEFIFNVDATGKVVSLENYALRSTLKKNS